MKNTTLAALPLLALAAVSCTQKNSLSAKIDGWDNDTIIINSISINGETAIDTVVANNGKFTYDVAPTDTLQLKISRQKDLLESPSRGQYQLAANQINVLVAGTEKIAVKGEQQADKLVYTSKGSQFETDRSQVMEGTIALMAEIDALQLRADSLIAVQAPREEIMPLFEQQMTVSNKIQAAELEFVKNHPDAEFSAYLLMSQPIDTVAAYYGKLNAAVVSGMFKNRLDNALKQYDIKQKKQAAKANIVPGKPAPNFTLTSIDGTPFSLSDIKDKYIVLDFWGNWCGWCVKGFPEMKKCYAKHSKKLEIIGIDCGDKEEVWKSAVAKYELPWTQVINGKDENDMTIAYAVEGFPTKIIIAPDHTIVEVAMGETEDFYTKIDELLK